MRVLGGDESSFTPNTTLGPIVHDEKSYDVVVVGSGLAGLSAATFLTDPKYKENVLVLEKEDHVGGLASGGELAGNSYSRGAAYWTDTYEEEQKILDYIGLGRFKKTDAIPEPIDAYLVRGKIYRGVWAPKTLKQLPASFALYKYELQKANDEGFIPNQPFEDFNKMDLDQMSAAQWIRSMPEKISHRNNAVAKRIYAQFQAEIANATLNESDPMIDVIELMDLYCRSALGGNSDKISAMAFANFYISEIVTRYTTPIGTSAATENMTKILERRSDLVTIKVSSPVVKITNQADHVDIRYSQDGEIHEVKAKYVVFAAQLKSAPKIIDGFAEKSPQQAALMSNLGYSHYSVHGVEIKGHPYRGAYDTWMHPVDYEENDPTDFILGRWVETHGFKKKLASTDDTDILTIYHPLPQEYLGAYSKEQAAQIAAEGTERVLNEAKQVFDPAYTSSPTWKNDSVISITTNMWPFSVHIAEPGHYISKVKILRKSFERVFFAHNNLGTPAFEEALFRGHCGANQALKRLVPDFKQEKWSQCTVEP